MKQIPLTKGHFAIVDDEDYLVLSLHKWLYHNGYADRDVAASDRRRFVFMHNAIMQPGSGYQVDHINLNRLDNRRLNLRLCTPTQNNANAASKVGTSKYKGVSWCKRDSQWLAQIQVNNKSYRLGQFDDEIAAAKVYDAAARERFGDYARLNFPLPGERPAQRSE